MTEVVQAAGCVPWRRDRSGVLVLLIHRDRYDDWSFPKGKAERGETAKKTALREVHEETGLVGEMGPELPEVSYQDHKDRQKTVRYWLLEVSRESSDAPFQANDEVDAVRWLSVEAAGELLTYPHDLQLLAHVPS